MEDTKSCARELIISIKLVSDRKIISKKMKLLEWASLFVTLVQGDNAGNGKLFPKPASI